jgi:hypothetical protein
MSAFYPSLAERLTGRERGVIRPGFSQANQPNEMINK